MLCYSVQTFWCAPNYFKQYISSWLTEASHLATRRTHSLRQRLETAAWKRAAFSMSHDFGGSSLTTIRFWRIRSQGCGHFQGMKLMLGLLFWLKRPYSTALCSIFASYENVHELWDWQTRERRVLGISVAAKEDKKALNTEKFVMKMNGDLNPIRCTSRGSRSIAVRLLSVQ